CGNPLKIRILLKSFRKRGYKAILVDKESYLLGLSRYIHLSPVKIQKIYKQELSERFACLRNYRWSSNQGIENLLRKG
ncbi:MAG: hypothetical protein AAB332_02245, partial [Planctomycetota bacterium]